MANTTIYPFGISAEAPTGLGIVNNLNTGRADQALSAEQGKVLNDKIGPAIDGTFTQGTYDGPRLSARSLQTFGIKYYGARAASQQGMDAYGNTLISMSNGGTHYIYQLASDGTVTQLASFSASTGHSNSLQFAPYLVAGQDFPYLYVSYLSKTCKVLSITSAYAVSIVQTITIGIAEVDSACNLQIGDDGYMWAVCQSGDNYHIIKFRRVAVSEGDVTLTSADILDEWVTEQAYPYATNVWQGMKIKDGRLWFVIGQTGSSMVRCLLVFDTTTHALVTTIDLSAVDEEFEDMTFWNDMVLLGTYGTNLYKLVL